MQDIDCCEFYAGVESIVKGFRSGPSNKMWKEPLIYFS